MKRMIAALIVVCLCATMTGCSAIDYLKASQLYKEEAYAQALPLYESLGDFADSAKMAEICSQKADYTAAEAFLASKDYEAALPLYEGLGMYADSPLKAITCRYENGLRYLSQADYKSAITWLEPLGHYEDCADRTSQARWLWVTQQPHRYIIRANTGDSLVMTMEATGEDTAQLVLERHGYLLGLPYDTLFTLTFHRDEPLATYQVTCRSESDTVIEEIAEGQVALRSIAAGTAMEMSGFSQTVTDAEGNQTTTQDAAQAIIVRSILAESAEQINQYFPTLLELSGTEVTAAHLGF